MQAAAQTLGNRAIRSDALDALNTLNALNAMDAMAQVREGAPLASALAGKKRFPGLLSQHLGSLSALNTEPSRDPGGWFECSYNGRITAAGRYSGSPFQPDATP